jgi:7-carboxy-7-deazaguanine synthase
MSRLLVSEIFHSIQGESSAAGLRFGFVRLCGCNLRCVYCDTAHAFTGGRPMTLDAVVSTLAGFKVTHVLVTGGEPLIQRATPELVGRLAQEGYSVSVETHGEAPIDSVVGKARLVMDIKTPSSGMCHRGFELNLPLLRPTDEVKFVLASPADYSWAKAWVLDGKIPVKEILFSPALPPKDGSYPGVEPRWLAEKILEDRLPVRLQLQIHKLLWGPDSKGR